MIVNDVLPRSTPVITGLRIQLQQVFSETLAITGLRWDYENNRFLAPPKAELRWDSGFNRSMVRLQLQQVSGETPSTTGLRCNSGYNSFLGRFWLEQFFTETLIEFSNNINNMPPQAHYVPEPYVLTLLWTLSDCSSRLFVNHKWRLLL